MSTIPCESPDCSNPARVHFTQLEGGKKTEIHLCEKCAEKQGVTCLQQHDMLQQILSSMDVTAVSGGQKEAACPRCGMTVSVFRTSGRLGCHHDYDTFREELLPLIERVHDATEHHGKVPSRADDLTKRQRQVQALHTELKSAVEQEEYEQAAELRDRIRRLEESGHEAD